MIKDVILFSKIIIVEVICYNCILYNKFNIILILIRNDISQIPIGKLIL